MTTGAAHPTPKVAFCASMILEYGSAGGELAATSSKVTGAGLVGVDSLSMLSTSVCSMPCPYNKVQVKMANRRKKLAMVLGLTKGKAGEAMIFAVVSM